MSLKDASELRLNDRIDHRDPFGRCILATIIEKEGSVLKIHYNGWKEKWDNWCDYATDGYRIAIAGSISKRSAHRFQELKAGDYVDVNPILIHPGWKCGEIRRLEQKSGQAQIVYELGQRHFLYWVHLDNEKEVAEFATKSGVKHQQKELELKISVKQTFSQPEEKHGHFQNFPVPTFDEKKINYREYCFRLLSSDEQIINPFNTGDWLEVKDVQTQTWMSAVVIDAENNWIVVNVYTSALKRCEKIHCIKHRSRWRRKRVVFQNKLKSNSEPAVFSSAISAVENIPLSLSAGNLEFKYFYDRQMRSVPTVQREKYYNKFISLGYNDIELIPYLIEDNFKKEIGMSSIHMRMFIGSLEIFKKSKEDFEDWMVKELEMKQHLRQFWDERIFTFDIFRRRIQSLEALLEVIGSENKIDCQKIWRKLPWMTVANITIP